MLRSNWERTAETVSIKPQVLEMMKDYIAEFESLPVEVKDFDIALLEIIGAAVSSDSSLPAMPAKVLSRVEFYAALGYLLCASCASNELGGN